MNIKIAEALPGVGPGKRGALPVGKMMSILSAKHWRYHAAHSAITFFATNERMPSLRNEYRLLICEVFAEYRQVLGAEKIWMILARRGHQAGAKFGADLMREMGVSRV